MARLFFDLKCCRENSCDSKKEGRPSPVEETAYLGRSCMGYTHCLMDEREGWSF